MAEKAEAQVNGNDEEAPQLTEKQLKKAAKKEAKKAKFEKKMEASKNATQVNYISCIHAKLLYILFIKKAEPKSKKKANKEVLTYDIPTPKGEKKGTGSMEHM